MEGFAKLLPPRLGRGYFELALREALARANEHGPLWVTGTGHWPADAPPPRVDGDPRLHVMLRGRHRIGGCMGGEYREADLAAGSVFFHPPMALTRQLWDTPCVYLGIVYRPALTRLLVVDFPGGEPPAGATPWVYHINRPLPDAARLVIDSLTANADGKAARDLVRATLRVTLAELTTASEAGPVSRSLATWQAVMEYIHGHYDQPLTRPVVAAALDLHPNYLSALCRQHGRRSFHDLVESVRLDRAAMLLKTTPWKLHRIAAACGYPQSTHFIRVFKSVYAVTPGEFRAKSKPPHLPSPGLPGEGEIA